MKKKFNKRNYIMQNIAQAALEENCNSIFI